MINDEERKRAVAELREASTGAYRHVDSLDVIANSIGVEVDGKFIHEVENETYAAPCRPNRPSDMSQRRRLHQGIIQVLRVRVPRAGARRRPDGVLVVTSEAFPVDWYSCPVCGAVVVEDEAY